MALPHPLKQVIEWVRDHRTSTDPHPGVYATASAITTHEVAADPHPVYETSAESAAKVTAHEVAADPHPGYATDADVALKANKAGDTFTGQVNLDGNARVGSTGTVFSRIKYVPHVYDAAAIPAGSFANWAITLPAGSCNVGDIMFLGDFAAGSAVVLRGWAVTGTDAVTVNVRNEGGVSADPPSTTLNFLFLRVA